MLKSARFTILPLEKRHLEDLRQMRNDPQTYYFLTSILPITQLAQEKWYEKMSAGSTSLYFAIENPRKKFIGLVRTDEWDKLNRSVRIGIDIHKLHRRKGYAIEAYKILFKYFFYELDMHRIWLLVLDINKPAIHLYKKLGFIEEGQQREAIYRQGKFRNYIMMSLLKKEYEKIYAKK